MFPVCSHSEEFFLFFWAPEVTWVQQPEGIVGNMWIHLGKPDFADFLYKKLLQYFSNGHNLIQISLVFVTFYGHFHAHLYILLCRAPVRLSTGVRIGGRRGKSSWFRAWTLWLGPLWVPSSVQSSAVTKACARVRDVLGSCTWNWSEWSGKKIPVLKGGDWPWPEPCHTDPVKQSRGPHLCCIFDSYVTCFLFWKRTLVWCIFLVFVLSSTPFELLLI